MFIGREGRHLPGTHNHDATAFDVHFTDGHQTLGQMPHVYKIKLYLNQFISNCKSFLCQAGGNAHVSQPRNRLPWPGVWRSSSVPPKPFTTQMPAGPGHTAPRPDDCAAFMTLGTWESGEAGSPWPFPSALCSSPMHLRNRSRNRESLSDVPAF